MVAMRTIYALLLLFAAGLLHQFGKVIVDTAYAVWLSWNVKYAYANVFIDLAYYSYYYVVPAAIFFAIIIWLVVSSQKSGGYT